MNWSRKRFKCANKEIGAHLNRLELLQENWESNVDKINALSTAIDMLEERDELFWHQRPRIKWLTEGDSNSRFFHQTTIQRMRFNKIEKLQDA